MATRSERSALRRAWTTDHRDARRVGDAVGCGACGFWMPTPESHCPNCGCPDPASGRSGRPDERGLVRLRRRAGATGAGLTALGTAAVAGLFAFAIGAPPVLIALGAAVFATTVAPPVMRAARNAAASSQQRRHVLAWEQMRPHGYRARADALASRRAELSSAIGRMRRGLHPPRPRGGAQGEPPPSAERASELREAIAAAEREWIEVSAQQEALEQRLLRSRAIPYLVALRDRDLDELRRAIPDAGPADVRTLADEARRRIDRASPDAAARWREIAERFDLVARALHDLELAHAASTVTRTQPADPTEQRDAVHDAAIDWLEDEALATAAFDEALAEIEADALARSR